MSAYLYMTKAADNRRRRELEAVFQSGEGARQAFYEKVIKFYENCWKDKEWVIWYWHRYEQRFRIQPPPLSGCAGQSVRDNGEQPGVFTLECASSVVTGQGQPSVLETHLTLHPIYGFPYFPGTMIKGAAAHYCHRVLGAQHKDFLENGAYYTMLFGSAEQAAIIQYEDAWPEPGSIANALCLDVLTPHHRSYQGLQASKEGAGDIQAAESLAPRDDDSPIPVHYLTASGAYTFKLVGDPDVQDAGDWLGVAERIVRAMLQSEGLGGKTNSGYGWFKEDKHGR